VSNESVKCVVLNATYNPLSVVSGKRGLVLCLKGKATVLEEHPDAFLTSGTTTFALPTQILLKEVKKDRPMTRKPALLTRQNLKLRDKSTCQYCGKHESELRDGDELTRDHVHPRAKGGRDEWKNVLLACKKCNNKKADLTLSEAGMRPLSQPYIPTVFELWMRGKDRRRKK